MAISTDSAIHFFGTQDTVTAGGGTSAVTNTSFSAAADTVTWTNDDDAPYAAFVLKFQYASGTITQDGIDLFMQLHNIDSTNDENQPDSNLNSHFMGTFPTDAGLGTSTDQYVALPYLIELPNQYTSQVYEFYIRNNSGVTMAAGWTLKITPVALGPHV